VDILPFILQGNITADIYFKPDTYWLKPQSIKYCRRKSNKKTLRKQETHFKGVAHCLINSYQLFIAKTQKSLLQANKAHENI